jgi:hypothetical protein
MLTSILVTGFLAAALLMPATATATTAHVQSGNPLLVKMTPIGNPAWTPVDLHVFTAPIGTAADGYAEFLTTMETILPPPHYQLDGCLGIGPPTPGTPGGKEAPPYTHDMADGVSNAGYLPGPVFTPRQFSNGQGVYFVFMVVPSSTSPYVGSSPDFSSGPIIPNSLFPIKVIGVTSRDNAVYDPNLANVVVPALTDPCVVPTFHVDGFSHLPWFTADNSDFGPPGTKLPGKYAYSLTMTDSAGNGWSISATFVVN